jgi:hypothetical protein
MQTTAIAESAPDHVSLGACSLHGRSLHDVDTSLLTLSPELLASVRRLAPGKRRKKVPTVVALGLLAILGVLGADRATRDFVLARASDVTARWRHQSPAVAHVRADETTSVSVPTLTRPRVASVSPTTTSDSPALPTSKLQRPSRVRSARVTPQR